MYRVELKDVIPDIKNHHLNFVPNVPCGVERKIVLLGPAPPQVEFLMYRVELKVLTTCQVFFNKKSS